MTRQRPIRVALLARAPERAGDKLLLTLQGYPLTAGGGTEVIKRLGQAAGVSGAIPHRFRHTMATIWLTRFPGDEVGLRRMLGHISPNVMRDYTHLAQTVIAQRAGQVSPTSAWLRERDA